MNQCVPNWNIDDPQPKTHLNFSAHLTAPLDPVRSRMDYEVAELTWENGQLALHGLVPPRPAKLSPNANLPPEAAASAWNKHDQLTGGTLESVVNQATGAAALAGAELDDNWFSGIRKSVSAVAIDAVVPCQDVAADSQIGDREGRRRCERMAGVCSCQGSAAASLTAGRVESTTLVTLGTCMEEDVGLTVTATTGTATNSTTPETEKTSLGKRKAISLEEYVSISHTSSQKKKKDTKTVTGVKKSSTSPKKSRVAAAHNQSERKRRDRINEKMKTLQKMVPNSSKTDKASMLDEVIEYLKQLQAQVQIMRMNNNMSIMMPMAMQQLQMPAMMAHMAQIPPMGIGAGMMNLANSIGQSMSPTLPLLHPSAFNPLAAGVWNGYGRPGGGVDVCAVQLACQMAQQQMSLEEYNRMAALFQQLYPPPPPPPPRKT